MVTPTPQQTRILDETASCVVVAQPGSGKTFTLACKIKEILKNLYEFQGVIAISYTNKASGELKKRSLEGGLNKKGSFFGTIDKFYISEIILPFGKHLFGTPTREFEIKKETGDPKTDELKDKLLAIGYENLTPKAFQWLGKLYLNGIILLETVGILALYILDNSFACRRYLSTRYSHIIIDEYQDSGKEQHELFVRLNQIGMCSIAVGDANQSIYAFSGKDSKYLLMLAQDEANFKTYPLSINHRCHYSIVDYSTRLLSSEFQPENEDEIRVFEKTVTGSEIDIARWIDSAIPTIAMEFKIEHLNDIGILVRGGRTGDIVHHNLTLKHKYFTSTLLDEDSSLWGGIFRSLLTLIFDPKMTRYEMLEEYINIDLQPNQAKILFGMIGELVKNARENESDIANLLYDFVEIARFILPRAENANAINILNQVLTSKDMLSSFKPAADDEIQLMTLHKSKGLEFDVVFHLDLYRFILPKYKCTESELIQDLNLHYVGITRAKKACFLCGSTERHRSVDKPPVEAELSPFLYQHDLYNYRLISPW